LQEENVIIILKHGATDADIDSVKEKLTEHGYQPNVTRGVEDTIVAAIGTPSLTEKEIVAPQLQALDAVEKVLFVSKPYKLVSRECHPGGTSYEVGPANGNRVTVGGKQIAMMAGPCSVENGDSLMTTAKAVREAGATILRGGAYKPRTSPVRLPGSWRRRFATAGRGARSDRNADHHRSDDTRFGGTGLRIRRRFADRLRATCRITTSCAKSASAARRSC
jgi:hypothetical protein